MSSSPIWLLATASMNDTVREFRAWLHDRGGWMHPDIGFQTNDFGSHIIASADVPEGTKLVSCPFSLAITAPLAKKAIHHVLGAIPEAEQALATLTERELIASYLVMHHVIQDVLRDPTTSPDTSMPEQYQDGLVHQPYINMLPSEAMLRTASYFTETELSLLEGTNLYYATLQRNVEWEQEWTRCASLVRMSRPSWLPHFTFSRYKAACTYISSRAFPSSLLSSSPTLESISASYPVLLPGVDSLNHKRGQKVTWMVETRRESDADEGQLSLKCESGYQKGQEIFNNYGLKSNAELILGYGFALEDNPEDILALKLGGSGVTGKRHEIFRGARGLDSLWEEMKEIFLAAAAADVEEEPETWDVELAVAEQLIEMVSVTRDKIEAALSKVEGAAGRSDLLRPEVGTMARAYLEGQLDIIDAVEEEIAQRYNATSHVAAVEKNADADAA